jgi:hypothetical protein
MRRALLAILLLGGCVPSSGIDPSLELSSLDPTQRREVCRFTLDLWAGQIGCSGSELPSDPTLCDDGRWPDPPCEPWTVGRWEDCVRAVADDPCTDNPACETALCL